MSKLYPLKFQPILIDKIWGGEKLSRYINKKSESKALGESWEISAVPGDISIISNGSLQGTSLLEVLNQYPSELLGNHNFKRFGKKFPLLIKFIDAKRDLSIQLHPDDKLAKERHNSFGKTEMWYVIKADKESNLIIGFKDKLNQETYLKYLKDKKLPEILNFEKVKAGDTFFIEAGRVHAIGAGVLLAEIQQTSDVTYRVYDWDRVDHQGQARELHNDIAIDAIKFDLKNDFKVNYKETANESNEMVKCPFFTTNFLPVKSTLTKQNTFDSFIIYICVDGKVEISTDDFSEIVSRGETILIPASIKDFILSSNNANLLEVYV
jgi:mannose-6-phosphate isomerase